MILIVFSNHHKCWFPLNKLKWNFINTKTNDIKNINVVFMDTIILDMKILNDAELDLRIYKKN